MSNYAKVNSVDPQSQRRSPIVIDGSYFIADGTTMAPMLWPQASAEDVQYVNQNQGFYMGAFVDAQKTNPHQMEMTAHPPVQTFFPTQLEQAGNEVMSLFTNYTAYSGSSDGSPPQSPASSWSPTSSIASLQSSSSIEFTSSTDLSEYLCSDSVAPQVPDFYPEVHSVAQPQPIPFDSGCAPILEVSSDELWAFLSQTPEHPLLSTTFTGPDEGHLWSHLKVCLSSSWFAAQSPEPKDDKGRSVLLAFLAQDDTAATYRCLFHGCDKQLDRQDRALGHVRMHLGHRPFACDQQCEVAGCQERFYCRSYLRSHTHRQKEECTRCSKPFFRKEMRKHKLVCPGLQNQPLNLAAFNANFLAYQSTQYSS